MKKSSHKEDDAILYYKQEDMTKEYDQVIMHALKRATNEEAEELGNLEIELGRIVAKCNELERRTILQLSQEIDEEEKHLELQVQNLKTLLKIRSQLLKCHEGVLEATRVSNKDGIVEYNESMIGAKEENILKLNEEMNPLKSQVRQIRLPNEELGEAKKEVVQLMRLKQSLLDNINENKDFVQNLKVLVGLSDESQHPTLVDNNNNKPEGVTVSVVACALCKQPLPKPDVFVAPCHCTYHPWCAVHQNWRSKCCAKKQCKQPFSRDWQQSMELNRLRGKQITYPKSFVTAMPMDCSILGH